MSQNDKLDFARLWALTTQGATFGNAASFANWYVTYKAQGGALTIDDAYFAFTNPVW